MKDRPVQSAAESFLLVTNWLDLVYVTQDSPISINPRPLLLELGRKSLFPLSSYTQNVSPKLLVATWRIKQENGREADAD